MAEYILSTSFLELINNSPKAGVRALGAAIDAKQRLWQSEPDVEHQVTYKDGKMPFKEDRFSFSAWDDDFGGDGEENIYRIFQGWAACAAEEDLKEIPDVILSEGGKALAWKAIFEAGAKRPDVLGSILWNSAIDPVVLSSINTRQAAIALIAATYPLAGEEQRKKAEKQILAYDFSHTMDPEYYTKLTVRSVFDAIGESNLASEQARDFLKAAREEAEASGLNESADNGQLVSSVGDEQSKVLGTPIEQDSVASLSRSVRSILSDESDESLKAKLWPEVTRLLSLIDAEQAAGGGETDAAVAGTLAKALGLALKSGLVPVSEVDVAVAKLIEISMHSTPRTDDKTEADFARTPVWSGNSARVDASEAIGKLIEDPHLWPKISKRYQELLHNDPHPAVRMNAIICLLRLWEVDPEAIWKIADKVAASEQNSAVLAFAAGTLAKAKSVAVEKVEPVFVKLSAKKISTIGRDNVVPATIAYFAVVKGLSASNAIFQQWIANFKDHESEIQKTLFSLRRYFVAGYAGGREQESFVRKNMISFLWELMGVLEPFISNWPNDREPTDEELVALKLFTQIGQQLYFAAAYKEGISLSLEEQRVFLAEYGPIISKLTTLGSPKTVHDCLQVLEKFIEADPVYCFELFSEAMLRKFGVAKYEYEHMGAQLFVKLVGLYLADYRYIFTDQVKKDQLVDCLAVFVGAGWPEARRLFQTLPDLR